MNALTLRTNSTTKAFCLCRQIIFVQLLKITTTKIQLISTIRNMTDSMKFGPGWLRNMSADNTNPNLSGGTSGSTNTNSSSTPNSNNGGNSQHPGVGGLISVVSSAARNTFPEFRYGREEMLSLFDKSCNVPEILPAFKKIFVEKVQYPLALTPSTDEELLPQVPSVSTQRPSWMQRSPVGFSSSTRGTGRGGSVDRGRMRGKSTYHQIYHRPTAMFGDDDLRSVPSMKTDRGWLERNGSGDTLSGIGGSLGSGTIGLNSDWNGTPTSSPRKEFSSHPRNMENWRRSRNEDGSGDASTSGLGGSDGWRGGSGSGSTSSGFNSTHRWGRSTSWRDEEIPTASADSSCGGSGCGITMQRSYSTITTVNERGGGYINNSSSILKTTQNHSSFIGSSGNGQSSGRILNSLNAGSTRNNQWNNVSGVNTSGANGGEIEENLPEWATENPSDGGGTFDATGAFHGSVDDEDVNVMQGNDKEQLNRKKSTSSSESSIRNNDIKKNEDNSESTTTRASTAMESDNKNNVSNSSEGSTSGTPTDNNPDVQKERQQESPPAVVPLNITTDEVLKPVMDQEKAITDLGLPKVIPPHQEQQSAENNINKNISDTEMKPNKQNQMITPISNANYYYTRSSSSEKLVSKSSVDNSSGVHRDLSDRMQEVADDMIEKLIMDDDTISIGDISSSGIESKTNVTVASSMPTNIVTATMPGNNLRGSNNFVVPSVTALLKQTVPHQVVQGSVSVSPTLPPALKDGGTHKDLQLYGGGVVDHTAIQHHHLQQQQQLAANISTAGHLPHTMNSTSAAPTDLWYYRDPQSKVQGPFTAIEMTEWYRAGYFNENLYVRRLCDTHFRSLGELIKLCNDNMPFTHSHLIPMSLDSIHLSNTGPRQPLQKSHYNLKPQNSPNEQREEIKGGDFLSGSVKNLMNPMSQMYFQMLHHREMLLLNELSKTECFQRLTPSEKEAVVRQKLQIHGLPDYVNNVGGLSSSLSSMTPTTGSQIYDVLAECAKKDHMFGNVPNPAGANNSQQPPQPNANPFIETDDFILNSQQHPLQTQFPSSPFSSVLPSGGDGTTANKIGRVGDDSAGNDVLNSLNLHLFLPGGGTNSPQIPHLKPQDYITTTNTSEYLGEQPLLGATATTALLQNNNVIHPWLPQMGNSGRVALHQSQLVNLQQTPQQQNTTPAQNNQWTSGLLVGIPMTVMPTAQLSSGSNSNANVSAASVAPLQQQPQQQKSMPTSMWDLPTITRAQVEQQEQEQLQQHHQTSMVEFDDGQNSVGLAQQQPSHPSQKQHKESDAVAPVIEQQPATSTFSQQQQQQHKTEAVTTSLLTSSNVKPRKDDSVEKYQNGNKRTNKQPVVVNNNKPGKDENATSRKNEEERRREQAEDKRRQKEEKKRQQFEEEKRRQQQTEEEKRRQMLEEKERQQQIQAQRRKAMLVTGVPTNAINNGKQSKEQQRVQSSIAPWSIQTTAAASKSGPCFAEIQKAERRERRADQQRQLELLEKQMRANAAAAAEANDSMLKWNASPVPVKSFAEIQAEEAKRLANEQLEMQRRKEQEMQQVGLATALQGGPNVIPSNANSISAIWTGTKVWSTNISAGFWEEPTKFSATIASNNASSGITAAAVVGASLTNNSGNNGSNNISNINNNSKQGEQQKLHSSTSGTTAGNTSQQHQQQNATTAAPRNLRKSQTVSVMQSASNHNGKNVKNNNQQQQVNAGKTSGGNSKAQQQQKSGCSGNGDANDKKGSIKNPQNTANTNSSNAAGNKRDNYENEFTVWCTKSLNNMNTKVDVPTFATFLQDLESPYEVKDYVRMYLGESKEYTEFAKQFLERRSKYKNLQRAQNAHNDDMCKPAPAITPSGNDNSDNRGKQKKVKKNKMTKLDARILGFSVTAAEGRTNVGDRAYVDAP